MPLHLLRCCHRCLASTGPPSSNVWEQSLEPIYLLPPLLGIGPLYSSNTAQEDELRMPTVLYSFNAPVYGLGSSTSEGLKWSRCAW